MEGMERMLRYALQLSYLNQLHKAGKITESEYLRIRKNLMKDYGVVSDILAGRLIDSQIKIHTLTYVTQMIAFFVSLRPEHMIHMHRYKDQIVHVCDAVKRMQQTKRIRSARDADNDSRGRRYKAVVNNCVYNVVSFHITY